jgi:hypothetical protein
MKKLILVLAILVAAPVVTYGALDVSMRLDANDVNIVYTGGDPCNLPRAFALKIELVGGTDPCIVIKEVSHYKTNGESTSASKGYGIYPATIAIDSCGVVNSWGSPLADPNDPGGSKALPSKTIILELGSLYAPVHDWVNAPDPCGILCELHFDCNGSNGNVNIRMTDEDTYRGGVVLEDGTTVDVNKTLLYTPCVAAQPPTKCLKSPAEGGNSVEYNAWQFWGEPNCWCFKRQCRGDANGGKLGAYWVGSNDLNLLRRAINKNDSCLATISYSGVPGICADFDHVKQGSYRVVSTDLNILRKYVNQPEVNVPCCDYNAPGTAPDCNLRPPADPNDKWNFWQVK